MEKASSLRGHRERLPGSATDLVGEILRIGNAT
jgi:hypothetical protein